MNQGNEIESFRASLAARAPPAGLAPALRALWHLAKGDRDAAHRIAQDVPGRDGAWVHAHLHRIEGDHGNAAYWYRRAGRPVASASTEDEWDEIAAALLAGAHRSQRGAG